MATEKLLIGYETAFWIWRKAGHLAFSVMQPSRMRSLAGGTPTEKKIAQFRKEYPDLATESVDVIVQAGDQRNLVGVKNHVKYKELPERSFYKLDDGVYIASPELCMMQLAAKLSVPQALMLASEMCGTYAVDPLYDDPGFYERPALTTPTKLSFYAARLYKPNSRAHATEFLKWLAGSSASPRETALYMLLCLPPRFGGYGIALPELNKRIELDEHEQLMVGVHHFDCDLYWHDAGVAVEYDSARHHTREEKQERDAIRRNMLQYKDTQVIVATRKQVNSPAQFDNLARQVAREVGKRLRPFKGEHIEARRTLRKTLFDWDVLPRESLGAAAAALEVPDGKVFGAQSV